MCRQRIEKSESHPRPPSGWPRPWPLSHSTDLRDMLAVSEPLDSLSLKIEQDFDEWGSSTASVDGQSWLAQSPEFLLPVAFYGHPHFP